MGRINPLITIEIALPPLSDDQDQQGFCAGKELLQQQLPPPISSLKACFCVSVYV